MSIDLSYVIKDFYSKTKLDKAQAILTELRSGKYYYASNMRRQLIGSYLAITSNLSPRDYERLKKHLIPEIPALINERNTRKIAYILLSQIIEYSCKQSDMSIYTAYEAVVMRLANTNKDRYLYHVITLAQTCDKLFGNIEAIEDYFIKRYLSISRINTINYKYLIDFTMNVNRTNKKKFLRHINQLKPFRNDNIIKSFIMQHDELSHIGTLI